MNILTHHRNPICKKPCPNSTLPPHRSHPTIPHVHVVYSLPTQNISQTHFRPQKWACKFRKHIYTAKFRSRPENLKFCNFRCKSIIITSKFLIHRPRHFQDRGSIVSGRLYLVSRSISLPLHFFRLFIFVQEKEEKGRKYWIFQR